jgi:membrane-bound ClpP family serine protease
VELPVDKTIKESLNNCLNTLEEHLNADVLWFFGPIHDGSEQTFLELIEQLADDNKKKETLYIVLTTPGGSAVAVERYVNIIRHHYKEVNFIVPNYAYSAGTIFCMSGDNIFMDYSSVLGPIDPQIVNNKGDMVPALGYLDKVNELIQKSQKGQLSQAEFIILKEFDLAELRAYEQAKELTIDQLKKWLVQYKFKNWNKHKNKKTVTMKEKIKRAQEIADKLNDSNVWKSHGRPIDITILENELKLKIEDFGKDQKLSNLIRTYYRLIMDYIKKNRDVIFIHSRRSIYAIHSR